MDAFEGVASTIDFQLVDRFPAHKSGEQPGQAQDMIEMAVGDQDPVKAFETDPGLENLALGAFPAVDQEAMLIVLDHLGRQAAPGRRGGGGCAEKDDFKQWDKTSFQ
jgi:hypothetical protein